MKRCWAYQPIAGSKTAWVPCARMAEEGSKFCARHGAAITGALLGTLVHLEDAGAGRKQQWGRRRGRAGKK